jgi:hypothetical protein
MPSFSHGEKAAIMDRPGHRRSDRDRNENNIFWLAGKRKFLVGLCVSGDGTAVGDETEVANRASAFVLDESEEKCETFPDFCKEQNQFFRKISSESEEMQAHVDERNPWPRIRQRRRLGSSGLFTQMAIAFSILSFTLGQVPNPTFYPGFEWGGQTLIQCAQPDPKVPSKCLKFALQPDKVIRSGEHRACSNAPAQEFFCRGSPLDPEGPGCSCNGACTNYTTYWEDLPAFMGQCLTVIYGLEDTWIQINMRIRHFPFVPNVRDYPLMDYVGPIQDLQYIKVQLDVLFGTLDVFDSEHQCNYVRLSNFTEHDRCDIDLANGLSSPPSSDKLASLTYEKERMDGGMVLRRRLILFGSWKSIDKAMISLKYKPDPNVNTFRIRSQLYMDRISRKYTYETMVTRVFFAALVSNDPVQVGPTVVQMIHIVDVNDAPKILHPKDQYTPPEECSDPASENEFCNFGQFFATEDNSDSLQISGISVTDEDIYEQCPPKPTFECAKANVQINAYKGAVQLNTRSNLDFYDNARSKIGFTSVLTDTINAVKVLYYRVETAELVGSPASSVLNYNTQRFGEKTEEYLTVTVSDQGFSGETGIAQFNTIRIDIVIVARNKAPSIYIGVKEFSVCRY